MASSAVAAARKPFKKAKRDMYFVTDVKMWRPTHEKCEEMQEYVTRFEHRLIKDEDSLESMVIDLKNKAKELDDKSSGIVKLCVKRSYSRCPNFLFCRTDDSLEINVFALYWKEVKGVYGFAEEVVKQNKTKEICID